MVAAVGLAARIANAAPLVQMQERRRDCILATGTIVYQHASSDVAVSVLHFVAMREIGHDPEMLVPKRPIAMVTDSIANNERRCRYLDAAQLIRSDGRCSSWETMIAAIRRDGSHSRVLRFRG